MIPLIIAVIVITIIVLAVQRKKKTGSTAESTVNKSSANKQSAKTEYTGIADNPTSEADNTEVSAKPAQNNGATDQNYTYNNDNQPLFDQKTLKAAIKQSNKNKS